MTPAARIKATLELLANIRTSPVPMDTTIGDYMRGRRYIGSKDRTNIAERLYNIVRAQARLGWWLDNRLIFWLALAELKSGVFKIEELFDGGKYGAEKLNPDEKKLAAFLKDKMLDDPAMPVAVRAECPPDYEEKLHAFFARIASLPIRRLIRFPGCARKARRSCPRPRRSSRAGSIFRMKARN